MRALVVEDELTLGEMFGEFLRGLGHQALIAP
jgi:hypothetical protein